MVVAENDDARGVLQLSSSSYEADESSQNFVTVIREAGTFGVVRMWYTHTHTHTHTHTYIIGGTLCIPNEHTQVVYILKQKMYHYHR